MPTLCALPMASPSQNHYLMSLEMVGNVMLLELQQPVLQVEVVGAGPAFSPVSAG
jgi:hypothetical protein